MTVAAEIPLALYDGDGVAVAFPAPWRYLSTGNLLVELISAAGVATTQTQGTHYSATAGATDAGGTVTMVTPPATGQKLRIRRVTPLAQQTAYPTTGSFPAASHELALDKLTLIAQEQAGDTDDLQGRSLQVPFGATAPVLDIANVSNGEVLAMVDGKFTGLPNNNASAAEYAIRAERAAALLAIKYIATFAQGTAGGIAATSNGDTFAVIAENGTALVVYRNNAGAAVDLGFAVAGEAAVDLAIAEAQAAYSLASLTAQEVDALEVRVAELENATATLPGVILGARFDVEGWRLEIDMPASITGGTFDLTKIGALVRSWGFTNAVRVVKARWLMPTIAVRRPTPNQTSPQVSTVDGVTTYVFALPQQVFSKEKASGSDVVGVDPKLIVQAGFYTGQPGQAIAITNLSIEPYPVPVGSNQLPPWRLIGATGEFDAVASSYTAQSGRTIETARCILTGLTSAVVRNFDVQAFSVSTMFPTQTAESIGYIARPAMADFTQNEVLTEDWQMFPFIGDRAADTRNTADHNTRFMTYRHVCNKSGTYGLVHAVLNTATGNDTTGAASTTSEAAAAATPFATLQKALYAAQVLNNSANGKNNGGGIIIYFANGDYTYDLKRTSPFTPIVEFAADDLNLGDTWTIFRPVTGATAARILRGTNKCLPRRVMLQGFHGLYCDGNALNSLFTCQSTVRGGSWRMEVWNNGSVPTDDGAANHSTLHFFNCGDVYSTGFATASVSNQLAQSLSSSDITDHILVRDVNFARVSSGKWHAACGVSVTRLTASLNFYDTATFPNLLSNDQASFVNLIARGGGVSGAMVNGNVALTGFILINVLLESFNNTQPALRLSADGELHKLERIFIDHLTTVGNRWNMAYEDNGVIPGTGQRKKVVVRNSVPWERNHKDDTYPTANPLRTHTWAYGHAVGCRNNDVLTATSISEVAPGPNSWMGEVFGPGERFIGADRIGVFVNYQADYFSNPLVKSSGRVTGTGYGDYRPLADSVLSTLTAEQISVGLDMTGAARRTDGTERTGAYARVA